MATSRISDHSNELNLALSQAALIGHLKASRKKGDREAVRDATASLVAAVGFLSEKIGKARTMAAVNELLRSL